MATFKVIVAKLNKRSFIPAQFPESGGIAGVVNQDFTFQGTEVTPVPNAALGKWYRDGDGYYYWGNALMQLPTPVQSKKVILDQVLRDFYTTLFQACVVHPQFTHAIDAIIETAVANQNRYQTVATALGGKIPWYFIAIIHNMEASQNFKRHLHNGDPLTARTVHVPANRPASGTPPFTWEQSAEDALTLEGIQKKTEWALTDILYTMEGYNGWGYHIYHPTVNTPYLWSGSNNYVKGKYGADGKWDADLVSVQIGGAVILKRMVEKGILAIS